MTPRALLVALLAVAAIGVVLWDAFESVVLPRRVTRQYRLTSLFFRATWPPFRALATRFTDRRSREALLAFYGPMSMIALLVLWAAVLVVSFGALHWSIGSRGGGAATGRFVSDVYMSGSTFFTLGFGDFVPANGRGRLLAILEAGTGFGFLAIVIGYLPVLYQAFSRREVNVSLLDARAGSPPSAPELLRRAADSDHRALAEILHDWEYWSSELLESHLSYPVLCYYRSQHSNQSWLAALTTILDTSTLTIVAIEGAPKRQARLTFAMARHAVIDLTQIFGLTPETPPDRLSDDALARVLDGLEASGLVVCRSCAGDRKIADLRAMYEPYVGALSRHLAMTLPTFDFATSAESWKRTSWTSDGGAVAGSVPGRPGSA